MVALTRGVFADQVSWCPRDDRALVGAVVAGAVWGACEVARLELSPATRLKCVDVSDLDDVLPQKVSVFPSRIVRIFVGSLAFESVESQRGGRLPVLPLLSLFLALSRSLSLSLSKESVPWACTPQVGSSALSAEVVRFEDGLDDSVRLSAAGAPRLVATRRQYRFACFLRDISVVSSPIRTIVRVLERHWTRAMRVSHRSRLSSTPSKFKIQTNDRSSASPRPRRSRSTTPPPRPSSDRRRQNLERRFSRNGGLCMFILF